MAQGQTGQTPQVIKPSGCAPNTRKAPPPHKITDYAPVPWADWRGPAWKTADLTPALLPGCLKFCNLTTEPQIKSFGWGNFLAVRPPILVKSGRKGARKNFLTFITFLGAVWTENISFPNSQKNATMTMQIFVFILPVFFPKLARKPRWDLASVRSGVTVSDSIVM